jgi:hypothetical protein
MAAPAAALWAGSSVALPASMQLIPTATVVPAAFQGNASPAIVEAVSAEPPPTSEPTASTTGSPTSTAGSPERAPEEEEEEEEAASQQTLPTGVEEDAVQSLETMGFARDHVVGWLYHFRNSVSEGPAELAAARLLDGEVPEPVVDQTQAIASLMDLFGAARVKPTRDACAAALDSCGDSIFDGATSPAPPPLSCCSTLCFVYPLG